MKSAGVQGIDTPPWMHQYRQSDYATVQKTCLYAETHAI